MKVISSCLLISALVLKAQVSFADQPDLLTTATEPDTDGDGVSNYDDYCPNTPKGMKVWTKEAVAKDPNAKPNWVGCGGAPDTAVPGYTPPARPREQTIYDKVAGLYAAGTVPSVDNLRGITIGRCFRSSVPTEPVNKAMTLRAAVIPSPNGPISGDVLAMNMTFHHSIAANALDSVNSVAELESIVGKLDPDYSLSPTTIDNGDITAVASDNGIKIQNWVRLNGSYLVVKHVESRSSLSYYCYFFKKIMKP